MEPVSLHIFTEEMSAFALLNVLLPKILPVDISFRIYPHQGKQDLEKRLPSTLPSISVIPNVRILIIRDQDGDNCIALKQKLHKIVQPHCKAPYLIRIACRSLENWMLGDLKAIACAYRRFKAIKHSGTTDFKNVDSNITDGPGKLLRIIPELQGASRLPKIETATRVAAHMNADANTSTSFNHTIAAIRRLIGTEL